MAESFLNPAGINALSQIAVAAGRAIMEIYNQPDGWGVEMKADDSPLTQADLRANDIIVTALLKLEPHIPVLSEESPWRAGNASTYWAVDPLDGTKEFIKRNGEFTVNIALVIDGVARMGVIYAPAMKKLWAGIRNEDGSTGTALSWAGCMALKDDDAAGPTALATFTWTAIATSMGQETPSERLRLLGSRSHAGDAIPVWLSDALGTADILECGSSLKFCLIAQGDADVYVRMGPTCIWDTAAGHAILAAAGGHVVALQTLDEVKYDDPRELLNPKFIAYSPGRITLARSEQIDPH